MHTPITRLAPARFGLSAVAALVLSACGGGGSEQASQVQTGPAISMSISAAAMPADAAVQEAQPTFHIAPVVLDEPSDADAVDNTASARVRPHTQSIPSAAAALETRGLTVQALQSHSARALSAPRILADGTVAPLASTSVATTYTPAQIRAAYGMPTLQSASLTPTAAQAAQQGAGQTLYIVDAMHDPNAAAELAAFSAKFGLPSCSPKAIAATAALPIAAPTLTEGCSLSIVYSTPAGGMTATAPAYNAGWATEIALDLQWAHATAPRARIVLIEAADASLNALLGAVKLANAMGAGAVSMSFGGSEGTWTSQVDPAFAASGMTYLAATGDSGSAVSWPAVSPNVIAVGGTSLSYSGSGSRSESTWSRTGGGISAYTATPAYQSIKVPGMGTMPRRAVADVAFNADPSTGQFVAVMTPGSSVVNWLSAGGTSLSTPQWAGLVAIANAMRVQANKPLMGASHALLYTQIATVPGAYAAAFADVAVGANGTCATCAAKSGYDIPTGLGTPNVTAFLSSALGLAPAPVAPAVPSLTIAGKAGVSLSFNVVPSIVDGVSYALVNAPAGMSIARTGQVTWPKPSTGTYVVTATVTDPKTGLTGAGVYTVKIDAPPVAPVVTAGTVNGKAGVALSYAVLVTSTTANSFTVAGATGMSISPTGVISWPNPAAGTYAVTVTALNTSTGLSGQGVLTFVIAKATPPLITAPALTGVAGKPLSGAIQFSSPSGSSMQVMIYGVPAGVSFSVSGQALLLYWASPVTGKYSLSITATDSAGLATTAAMPITINAK